MAEYLIYFNQQWVGDHPEEWFRERGPLAKAVVDEIKAAGEYLFAGGLEENSPIFSADATSGTLVFTDGPYVETKEWLGGLTVVDVADEETARMWAARSPKPAAGPRRSDASAAARSEWSRRSQLSRSGSPGPPDRWGWDLGVRCSVKTEHRTPTLVWQDARTAG